MEENIDLEENEEKLVDNFQGLISVGKLNQNIKDKMMIHLLDKAKENLDKEKEMKKKLKELNDNRLEFNSQLNQINEGIENQNQFLKKIKNLYIFLVNLLMRKKNFFADKNCENKMNIGNNEIKKNKCSKTTLFDFIHKYADYVGHKNIIGLTNSIKNNRLKINNIKKNNILNRNYLTNIVEKGEAFRI